MPKRRLDPHYNHFVHAMAGNREHGMEPHRIASDTMSSAMRGYAMKNTSIRCGLHCRLTLLHACITEDAIRNDCREVQSQTSGFAR